MLVYQNETRLVGRPDLPVIITETGWCAHDDLHVSGTDQSDGLLVPRWTGVPTFAQRNSVLNGLSLLGRRGTATRSYWRLARSCCR